jgi:hypothetical protein
MPATPKYPIGGHPLLSDDVAALDVEALDAQTLVAERVLGLAGTTLTGTDVDEATNAVAMQVNYQVALPPEVWVLTGATRGARSESYRGALPPVHPHAQVIVAALLPGEAGGWMPFGRAR